MPSEHICIDIQVACDNSELPNAEQLQRWADAALASYNKPFELTIRMVSSEESQQLNHEYRGKDKPTNVLSFPFEVPEGIELDLLGDLVVCADVVEHEAKQQNKPLFAHWAHMIIHGCLHLLGFDHINEDDANEMEAIEIKLLAELGISNPYIASDD
ncbi:rRNA maturation RNase YbeY [Thalassotalea sp. HSM 43]|uniref:rRNA maturation RNase YbeY n=1 Tax=Thalassotalea sp. HSM 43 TaxID=2552945 RepID=UPI001081DA27|nr:rRNA maturation RNase YbeY [Thalassotalea sp. HSM 43]QBY05388.1 rRNA maturation RNase YbeY [Thalassotalea sp. HSM 43]